ncbi:hypothetical protein HMPREF1395_01471 [Helicobacter pylori GAM112Ai]|nr:hypothetical protein HMPREF1395_01471 [Helicobacter pylori GAM112Ai]EMH32614.1 hypothetical protein HMPREF1424_00976 [Helicobacter pylori GAM42Ai]
MVIKNTKKDFSSTLPKKEDLREGVQKKKDFSSKSPKKERV